MIDWLDIYLAQAEGVQVTQRWLDAELEVDTPDFIVIRALTGLLRADISLLKTIERRMDDVVA